MIEAEGLLGGQCTWKATNPTQKELLSRLTVLRQAVTKVPTLQGWAKKTAEELNQILRENGLSIQLRPWLPGSGFGVVAINKYGVQWLSPGLTSLFEGGPRLEVLGHPAFLLKSSTARVKIWETKSRKLIVKVPTKSGDTLCLSMEDRPLTGFGLHEYVESLQAEQVKSFYGYEGAILPMVKHGLPVDLDWLRFMEVYSSVDGNWFISQALQEIQFSMNQFGAAVTEAAAMSFARGMPQYLEVNKPFVLWIERPGVEIPLNVFHITPEDWKDPGNLAKSM